MMKILIQLIWDLGIHLSAPLCEFEIRCDKINVEDALAVMSESESKKIILTKLSKRCCRDPRICSGKNF